MRPELTLIELLTDQAAVLDGLTPAEYARRPESHPCTVGQQVRHCLDHVTAVLEGAVTGRIDYETRERGSVVETDPVAAIGAMKRLAGRIAALRHADLDRPVRVVERVSPVREPVESGSTLGRELAFVTSHTTHHNALIAVMARSIGQTVPERFGYGASTIVFLDRPACAR